MQAMCLIPGWGTKIPHVTWYIQEKKKKKKGKKCLLSKPACLWYLLQSDTEELKPDSRKLEALFLPPASEIRIISQAQFSKLFKCSSWAHTDLSGIG